MCFGIAARFTLPVFVTCVLYGLPERQGPRVQTSGKVPHVQIGVNPNAKINAVLNKLAFTLPELEKRPTVVSLPGAIGMWLEDGVPVQRPKAIVRGREFAHIHWADRNDGWEGLVMLYSASTDAQLDTLIQLITESYNHVTGRNISVPDC